MKKIITILTTIIALGTGVAQAEQDLSPQGIRCITSYMKWLSVWSQGEKAGNAGNFCDAYEYFKLANMMVYEVEVKCPIPVRSQIAARTAGTTWTLLRDQLNLDEKVTLKFCKE